MKKEFIIIILTSVLTLSSCGSSFIAKQKSRNIKVKPISNISIKVGTENEKVKILFDKGDLIQMFQKEYANYSDPGINQIIKELKSYKNDFIFNDKNSKGKMNYSSFELMFHELLKEGKTKILDKKTKTEIERFKYTFVRDKLGGEECYFSFKSGEEFYEITLALGE